MGYPLLLGLGRTLMSIRSHRWTSSLPWLRVWVRPVGPLNFGPLPSHALKVGLLAIYTLGPNHRETFSDPYVCRPDLRPGEARCSHVSKPSQMSLWPLQVPSEPQPKGGPGVSHLHMLPPPALRTSDVRCCHVAWCISQKLSNVVWRGPFVWRVASSVHACSH
jgi:hypothetical protein